VIEVDPTVATTSDGASRFDCCADVEEQAVRTATTAPTAAPGKSRLRMIRVYGSKDLRS
jgi:hypothetical protein